MEYKYSVKQSYEDYASGRVLYGAKGIPNFPVRLINEIFKRCQSHSVKKDDINLYDCCCGGGYLLTVLGLLNQETISKIYASDIDNKMLKVAEKNLSLLSYNGIESRLSELNRLYQEYRKESHMQAISSAQKFKENLLKEINVEVFQTDATKELKLDNIADIIITDVPYGNMVEWQGEDSQLGSMIEKICNISNENTIIAICMDKKQKINNSRLHRLEKNNIGKRKFEIYKLA